MQDGRGIDASAEPHAQRDIGNEMFADRLLQERVQFLARGLQRVPTGRALRQTPVSLRAQLPIAPLDPMSRQDLLDSVHQRPRRRHVIQRQIAIQAGQTQPALNLRMNQDCLQLRPEKKFFTLPRDVKRLDAHAISRQDEAPGRSGPKRNRKHAAQPLEGLGVPLQKRAENGFCIAMRLKVMAQAFQLAAEFQVVVDLAIEDDGRFPVVACYRLIAAHEVDDLQAGCAESADVRTIYALLVRASVNKRRGGYLNAPGVGRPILMRKTSYATQNAKALLQ